MTISFLPVAANSVALDKYIIQQSDAAGPIDYEVPASTALNANGRIEFEAFDLVPATEYTFSITTVDQDGQESEALSSSYTTFDAKIPIVNKFRWTDVTTNEVQLSWDRTIADGFDDSGAVTYKIKTKLSSETDFPAGSVTVADTNV